jgi:oligopeptidase B
MLDSSLPLTPPEYTEWGNPEADLEVYQRIASYSPYDNVRAQAYPHLLVTAGISDPRVTYWEPAKWVAKLRLLKTSDHVLLFRTNMSSGHRGASGRYEALDELALEYTFLLVVYGRAGADVTAARP